MEKEVKNAGTGVKAKKSRKKILAVIFTAVILLLAATAALYGILSGAVEKELVTDYEFCDPDWSKTANEVMSEPEYADVGWYVTYTDDRGESVAILDDDYLRYGIGVELLSYYFAAVQSGDAGTYNSLFSAEYLAANGEHPAFTPQRIYDIKVRLLGSQTDDDGSTAYRYEIGYKIMKNDGTFTRLIGSDMSRPQYFTVRAASDGVYIEKVETQGRY